MRVVLGLAVLVIVLATVAQLVKSQLGSLSVTGAMPAPSSASASGLRSAPVADQIKNIMDVGVASRASEPQQ